MKRMKPLISTGHVEGPLGRRKAEAAGFTLVELLAVIGIIALLAGLLMPSFKVVRGKTKDISCVNNLRQIGIAVRAYADENNGKMPGIEPLPSMPMDPSTPLAALSKALAPQMNNSRQVFRCPEDSFRFPVEGTSYEWNSLANGKDMEGVQLGFISVPPSLLILCYDYDNVHANRGGGSAKNFLFADGHISGQ